MSAIAFDTHTYVKKLVAGGFTERQAEAQTEALVAVIEENLATKQDIELIRRDMKELEASLRRDMKELETNLRRDMKELETNLRRDMKELELRLTVPLGVMLAAAIGIITALDKLL
jgi:predicted phage-related endonuclease